MSLRTSVMIRTHDDQQLSRGTSVWMRLKHNRSGMAGLVMVMIFLLTALASWGGLIGQDWSSVTGGRWESPGTGHWMGTNILGQDVME